LGLGLGLGLGLVESGTSVRVQRAAAAAAELTRVGHPSQPLFEARLKRVSSRIRPARDPVC